MRAAFLREKARDYLGLARGLSHHSPTRLHLITMAERFERRAKELEDEAGLRIRSRMIDDKESAEKQQSVSDDSDANESARTQ